MNTIRYLIASVALVCSTNAQAANFVEYTFTGKGILEAGSGEFYPPAVEFKSVFFAALDANDQCLFDISICYASNGTDSYNSRNLMATELTGVGLAGGHLTASDRVDYVYSSSTLISADFDPEMTTFASLNGSGFNGGKFTYRYLDHTGGLLVYGNLTGFSARKVDAPGAVTVSYSVVPETSTWGMMLAGFGMTGAVVRRRKKVSTKICLA